MSSDLVRICPACGAHHPPERMRCDCGALLFGVDLVRPVAPEADAPAAAAPAAAATPEAAPDAAPVRCPHDDCGQLNPAGSRVCLYCNRPLAATGAAHAAHATHTTHAAHAADADADHAPTLLQLPSALRPRYRVLRMFEARGAEADILLVEPTESTEPAEPAEPIARGADGADSDSATPATQVAKIYRQGIRPSAEVQARIARIDPRHCVRMFEAGLSDGRAYEVMEYCPLGALRQRIRRGHTLPLAFIVEVTRELAQALQAVHDAALVHRDLKPENVLVRTAQPLDLVLTDFSTASAIDATQRFTSVARTLMYAAPEAISGVIDAKADYWALGMTLLEMATGAHPFHGLSEPVILYHLTTRAIDLGGLHDSPGDPPLRKLIAGLLLRDPKRRWGAQEVSRWLAGDPSLPDAVERGVEPGFAEPYDVAGERCTTPEQLAVAYARHWQAGLADLANGQLLNWFTSVQKDQNAVRLLLELRYEGNLNPDQQLLHFILHYAPGLPPMWRGQGIELPALLTRASQALQGDKDAGDALHQLYHQRVLATYAAAGNAQMAELAQRWSAAASDFDAAWQSGVARLQKHAAQAPLGEGESANFDEMVYGPGANVQAARPPPAALHPRLLAIAYDPAWVERLRTQLVRELTALAAQSPPLATQLGDPRAMTPAQLLAITTLLPAARQLADQQAQRDAQRRQQQAHTASALRGELQLNLSRIALQAGRLNLFFPNVGALSFVLDEHAGLLARIRAHTATDDISLAMRRHALRTEPITKRLRDLCDRLGEQSLGNEGWLGEQAATFGFIALIVVSMLGGPKGAAIVLLAAATLAGWRGLPVLGMTASIRELGRSLQRQ